MASLVYPRLHITGPARVPRVGGLLAVTPPIDVTDPNARNGLLFEGDPCGALPDFAPGLCDPNYIPSALVPDEKDYGTGPNWTESFPFALYVGFECYMPGTDYEDKALSVLEAGESFGVERGLSVAVFQTDLPTVVSGSYDLKHGIAELEQLLGEQYAGRGLIHMSRRAASLASQNGTINPDPAWAMWTSQGTPVSNGAGYQLNGPSDTAPDAGKEWIYATGDVHVFRSAAETYGADNVTKNLHDALAERVYNVTIDCEFVLAVQVTI